MNFSSETHATLLLTVALGRSETSQPKPLAVAQWARLSTQLKQNNFSPADLLKNNPEDILDAWPDSKITPDRLKGLLDRGGALGFALDKWQRSGLWVMTLSDQDYPERLKSRLGSRTPPVLFGYGNTKLLNKGGVAVVGSRNASSEDLDFTRNIGRKAAEEGHSIVSGGARGVDEMAMLGTLDNGGTSIGVLASGLLQAGVSRKYREKIRSGDLALISSFNPEAGFNIGNAMARNKYIYCLADTAIVVSSTPHKGGTWSGATENLQQNWVPLWVKHTENIRSGNIQLSEKGARTLPKELLSLGFLVSQDLDADYYRLFLNQLLSMIIQDGPIQSDGIKNRFNLHEKQMRIWLKRATEEGKIQRRVNPVRYKLNDPTIFDSDSDLHPQTEKEGLDIYTAFLRRIGEITRKTPLAIGKIQEQLDLVPQQVRCWLERGVREDNIEKTHRPVQYRSRFGDGQRI